VYSSYVTGPATCLGKTKLITQRHDDYLLPGEETAMVPTWKKRKNSFKIAAKKK
jgi:hypothetical protein